MDACAASMRAAILGGEIVPGTRLPAERALAKSFGVNRVTVRSALGRLAAARLVSVRQGSGYVVRDFRRDGGPDLLPSLVRLARDGGDFVAVARDLLLVRRQLARAVLERVAAAADDAAVRRVRDAVQAFCDLVAHSAGTDAVAEADLTVLAAIVAATGSPVLGLFANPVAQLVRELPELRQAIYAQPETNAAAYRVLLLWLEARRPDLIDAVAAELARRDEESLRRIAAQAKEEATHAR